MAQRWQSATAARHGLCGWFNGGCDREGQLFQDRYKSEPVEDDSYFLTVLRYIYQNPVKAGFARAAGGYPWSGYRLYLQGGDDLVTTGLALSMFAEDKKPAIRQFEEFTGASSFSLVMESRADSAHKTPSCWP